MKLVRVHQTKKGLQTNNKAPLFAKIEKGGKGKCLLYTTFLLLCKDAVSTIQTHDLSVTKEQTFPLHQGLHSGYTKQMGKNQWCLGWNRPKNIKQTNIYTHHIQALIIIHGI